MSQRDIILEHQAVTLAGAFRTRVKRSPDAAAYIQYSPQTNSWNPLTWRDMEQMVIRWQTALQSEGLKPGDRVAIMLNNCSEWIALDQAALGLGLVTVPLYTNDRAGNVAYILEDAGVQLLLIRGAEQWETLAEIDDVLAGLRRVVTLDKVAEREPVPMAHVDDWLPATIEGELLARDSNPDALASIVYTSGTTGRPKGVMLSHRNILWDADAGLQSIDLFLDDLALSFLPLSHTLERTAGYYLMILAGVPVAFARSIDQLAEDLLEIRPTILISVPRIFERVHSKIMAQLQQAPPLKRRLFELAVSTGWTRFEYQQGRGEWKPILLLWPLFKALVAGKVQQKLGGRLRFAVSGGAPLSASVAKLFIGLGIPIQQGYGLTETSPVISVNPLDDNLPDSVGRPLVGVEVRIGDNDDLLTRSPAVMLGYWNNPEETRRVIDEEGWLHTGDQARLENGHIYITGRIKEIIVLANGEKVSPSDMELAIALDEEIEQVMLIGEGRPYLSALLVPSQEIYPQILEKLGLDIDDPQVAQESRLSEYFLQRIQQRLAAFPGYAQVRTLGIVEEPWAVENEMMTPTLKLKRARVIRKHQEIVDRLYSGH